MKDEGVQNADGLFPCCADLSNRYIAEDDGAGSIMHRCRVCERRHFGIVVDPGELGVVGVALS